MFIERHQISQSAPLMEAIARLNELSGGVMTLIVTDGEGRMTGTLTDGDVRRALLRGVGLDALVADAMFREFRALHSDNVNPAAIRELRRHGLRLLPVLDADGRVCRIIDTQVTGTVLPVRAVLMAGGKGERLRPMTLTTPKPLLKIGDKAIIDYNIEALASVGVDDISVTVNYLAEQIENHFSEPVAGVKVKCLRESRALGTIGAVSLVDLPDEGDTIVMNSDLLTTISFEDLYLCHSERKADVTIAVVPYNVSVPYAIVSTDGENVRALEEKPSYSYYANAGIYIFSNRLLNTLDKDERTDAPDLIEKAIAEGLKVTYYPINGTWIDVGSPVDFSHASELMRHLRQSRES